jgi:DNA invertase Pin-like site-specific DNA recombinase
MMERTAIYARVSTNDQTTENQLLKLKKIAEKNGWEISDEYIDQGISGAKGRDKRPQFDRLCKDMVKRKIDRVMVWDVSRLGRSLQHLIEFLNEAQATRTDLYIHQSGIDTSTPAGRMMFSMVGVFAEFERSMISERVKAGLDRAKVKGKQLGRPSVNEELRYNVTELRSQGLSYGVIASKLGLGKTTVARICNV